MEEEIAELNEAIYLYEWFREEALERGDEKEVKFLNAQIQGCKRQKIALKKGVQFEEHPDVIFYNALMGA